MQQPDLNLLCRFIEAYEQCHHYPEVSSKGQREQIFRELENSLRCSLFNADYSKLTPQGELLYKRTKQLQQQISNLLQRPHSKPAARKITVGLDQFVPTQSLLRSYPRFISELSLQQLQIVQLDSGPLLQQLASGELDMVLRVAQAQKPPKTHSRRYCNLNLALACSANHSLTKHQQLSAEQLQAQRQLCLSQLPVDLKLNRVNRWQISHREMLHDLLVLGMGWALAPRHWLEHSFRNGSLVELHLSNYFSANKLEIEILWLSKQYDSQVAQCLNLLGLNAYDG